MSFKDQVDIVEVIQKYLKLQKRGKYFVALCPFHRETKPSFYVSPELQIFKCFGCGVGGNAISFVMKMENLGYREAVERIADWFGLSLEKETPKSEVKKFLEVNYAALKFFKENLTPEVKDYLHKRGLTEKTIEKYEIGFSPGGTLLRDYLYSLGFSADDLSSVGLLDAQKKDRFQSRIIFPLRDEFGRLLGFMGRIFPPDSELGPKYLNTPDTKIFQKGKFLYGLNFALPAIQEKKRAVVTEGTLDVILAQENGLKEIVASSGTSLTSAHLQKLKKYTNKIVFAFDNDEAGLRSVLRINPIAQEMGFETECLVYEGAKDLADWFLAHQVTELKTIETLDFLLAHIEKLYDFHSLASKNKALEEILRQIKSLNPIKKEVSLEKVSEAFKVAKEFLITHLERLEPIIHVTEEPEKVQLDDFLLFKYLVISEKLGKSVEDELVKEMLAKVQTEILKEEADEIKEMLLEYFATSGVDLEKEFAYLQKIIQEKALKERLKELENWLLLMPEESDKILAEIKKISDKLKNIHASK